MTTVALRMPDEQLAAVDALVAAGRYPTRTAALRAAVAALLVEEDRRAIDRQYVEGYTRIPAESPDHMTAWLADRSIESEPW